MTDTSKSRNQSYLLKHQYRTPANLQARMALHAQFSTNPADFARWIFDHLQAPSGARVLELGTGPARLWTQNRARVPEGWQVTLSDLSPGMVAAARAATADMPAITDVREIDAQNIPFSDATFDRVIANHMLYHVPDLDRAVMEIRRVLKPGGRLVAATNGLAHMAELDDFIEALLAQAGFGFERQDVLSFRLENGAEILSRQFANVELAPFGDSLEVTEAEPLIAYMLSMNRLPSAVDGLTDALLDTLIMAAQRELAARLDHGPIHITKATGLFVAY